MMCEKCAGGRPRFWRSLFRAACGRVKVACCSLDLQDEELAWVVRAHHSSDEVRTPHHCHKSTVVADRLLAWSDPRVPGPADYWPACMVSKRPQVMVVAVGLLGELDSALMQRALAEFAKRFVVSSSPIRGPQVGLSWMALRRFARRASQNCLCLSRSGRSGM